MGCGEVGVYGTPRKPRKHKEKNREFETGQHTIFSFGRRKMTNHHHTPEAYHLFL